MDSRTLEAAGWGLVRVKGSHHQFRHPMHSNRVAVQHPRKDIPDRYAEEHRTAVRAQAEGKQIVTVYIALLRKDPVSDYGVDFPDFPGCITAGSTLEEAREMAAEALEFHIEGMLEDGLPIPEPSSLEAVMADTDNAEAIPFLVPVPDRPSRTVRINVTMRDADLKAIDAFAKKCGKSRSALLAEAARKLIAAEREHHAA